jgi:hypothetical protein
MPIDLKAYPVMPTEGWTIEPATLQRNWMDQSVKRSAYRCLPLVLANQAGWIIPCPATFKVVWNGKSVGPDVLKMTFSNKADEVFRANIGSNFGSGIITFVLPWLFQTSKGYNLWVRGPSNMPRSDAAWLEGLVETDWSPYPFTMNWKIMKPRTEVWFKKGDPICMLVPFPVEVLEDVQPAFESSFDNPELLENYGNAKARRMESIQEKKALEEGKWELSYTRGVRPDGVTAPVHRTTLKLAEFQEAE